MHRSSMAALALIVGTSITVGFELVTRIETQLTRQLKPGTPNRPKLRQQKGRPVSRRIRARGLPQTEFGDCRSGP